MMAAGVSDFMSDLGESDMSVLAKFRMSGLVV